MGLFLNVQFLFLQQEPWFYFEFLDVNFSPSLSLRVFYKCHQKYLKNISFIVIRVQNIVNKYVIVEHFHLMKFVCKENLLVSVMYNLNFDYISIYYMSNFFSFKRYNILLGRYNYFNLATYIKFLHTYMLLVIIVYPSIMCQSFFFFKKYDNLLSAIIIIKQLHTYLDVKLSNIINIYIK